MNKKREPAVMILGASFLQVPMIETANRLGMRTIVVDRDPTALGAALASEFHQVSTIDAEAVLELAWRIRPDGITTAATDAPIRVVAEVGEALGLPTITSEAALACTDKAVMIRALEAAGIAHPEYAVVVDLAGAISAVDSIGTPCVMKPADSSGSRGVVLVREQAEAREAFEYAHTSSTSGEVLVEEYLRGPEVSCEVFHDGRTVRLLAITDKETTGAPHFVETGHTQPSRLPLEGQQKIAELAMRAVPALGITMGPAHVEIILTKRGPVIVEVGARLGGDLITSHLVPLSTGIDMVSLVLKQAVGLSADVPTPTGRAAAVRFLQQPEGILIAVNGLDEARGIPNMREAILLREIGNESRGTRASGDRIGYVLAAGESPDEVALSCESALNRITIEVEDRR